MPSSAQPAQAAQKPRIWLGVSFVLAAGMCSCHCRQAEGAEYRITIWNSKCQKEGLLLRELAIQCRLPPSLFHVKNGAEVAGSRSLVRLALDLFWVESRLNFFSFEAKCSTDA
jgi:hypothetical protein